MKFNILAILFSCCTYAATAQITVYDINKTGIDKTSHPSFLTPFEGKLYFMASDGIHGYELWGIDSTAGAFMVADINPGSADAWPGVNHHSGYDIQKFDLAVTYAEVVNKDALFFIADDGVHGCELYLYDGVNPPAMVKEFIPGPQGIKDVRHLAAIDNYIFVCEYSRGIWQYNLNAGDLKLLPGTNGVKYPTEMEVVNGVLYASLFRSSSPGYVLWKYNPSTGDTGVVATNLYPNPQFINISNKLYYDADHTSTSHYLYEYDGLTMPKAIHPYNGGGYSQRIGKYKNKIYFTDTADNVCEYDTISKNVVVALKNNFPLFTPGGGFVYYNDRMYFSAMDTLNGIELWEWDGTNPPRMAADIYKGPFSSGASAKLHFTVMPDGVYFVAFSSEQSTGFEVHRYKPFPATVQNLSFKGELRAYPNPVTSATTLELQLNTAQTLSVELYNTEGKRMMSLPQVLYSQGTGRVELDMRHLPAGNYFYHVRNRDNKSVVSGKLVKL